MSKSIQFSLGEQVLNLTLGSKVSKKDLYGYAKRVAVKDGVILSKASLMPNGQILPSGALSLLKVDPDGTPSEPVVQQIDGVNAELKPSSFDQPYALQPLPLITLASFAVHDVYPIDAGELPVGLYGTEFSYRKSISTNEALLFVRAEQSYLLVGRSLKASFLEAAITYEFFDADNIDEDSDELDFQMI